MSRNKEHRGAAFGGAPNGAAAFGGRPIGSVFFISAHLIVLLWKFVDIPYMFLIYSTYIYIYVLSMFHRFSFVCFVMYSANSFESNF